MQKLKAYAKKIAVIGAGALLIGASLGCVTDATHQSEIADAVEDAKITCGPGTVLTEDGKTCDIALPQMKEVEVQVFNELWSDDYDFNYVIEEQLGDNKIVKLMDDKVEVDDEKYDVAEYLSFSWEDSELNFVTSSMADKEMEGDSYLHVGEGSIRYEYRFEDALPELAVDKDVTIKFLGKDLKIVSFGEGKVTVKEANSQFVYVDGVVGKATVLGIGRDSVMVKVGDEIENLHKGDTKTINDVEVSVDSIFYVDEKEDRQAELTVGDDILRTIESGDSYDSDVDDNDAEWVYDITIQDDKLLEIALVYNQLRKDVDEDSDFKALAVGEELVLPNDYLRVLLKGTNEPEYLSVNLLDKEEGWYKLTASKDGSFVYDFEGEIEDYDKIYFDGVSFYEEYEGEALLGNVLKLDNTEAILTGLTLTVNGVNYNLLTLEPLDVEDEVVMTPYGVKFIGSEDWVEDESEKLTIEIPEEKLEGTLVVGEEVTEKKLVPVEEAE